MLTLRDVMSDDWRDKETDLIDQLLLVVAELDMHPEDEVKRLWASKDILRCELRSPYIWIQWFGAVITNKIETLLDDNQELYVKKALKHLDVPEDPALVDYIVRKLFATKKPREKCAYHSIGFEDENRNVTIRFNNELDAYKLKDIDYGTPTDMVARRIRSGRYVERFDRIQNLRSPEPKVEEEKEVPLYLLELEVEYRDVEGNLRSEEDMEEFAEELAEMLSDNSNEELNLLKTTFTRVEG